MRDKLNCPNCGAVINQPVCPYCGSVFYDFANIDTDKTSYLRLKIGGELYIFKAMVSDLTVHQEYDEASFYANDAPIMAFRTPRCSIDISMDILSDDRGVLIEKHSKGLI